MALPRLMKSMFGGSNPADAAMPYLEKIPDQISPYFKPYMDAGNNAIPELQNQYGNLLNDPGGMLNKMGGGFHESPGFKFALQQALQGAGHAAAAGGMAGSPQHEQQNMQLASDIGNQDYYHWLDQARGMYGAGLQGEQGLYQGGMQASTSMADQIAQMLAAQAGLSYSGAANQNEQLGNMMGSAASIASFLGGG